MKANRIFIALALAAAVACSPKGGDVKDPAEMTAADFKVTKAEKDSVSYLLGVNFGTFLKQFNFVDEINYSLVVKGMKDFVNAEGNMRDADFGEQFKIDPAKINDVFNAYLEKRQNAVLATNKEKEDKFLEKNSRNADVVTTASGLQYTIIEPGNDVKAGPADTVWVKYRGTLLDGTVFDEAQEEAVMLTLNRVIKGWTEGLQLVGEGGQIKLFIPSALGYGERGAQPTIEPNSTLLFDVTVEKVGKVSEE